ncbi:unnamed protein product [Symbiodinium sp. CCMP2456]|nr:unnamed protein product [Symbiodinium sp. CCMP2456]
MAHVTNISLDIEPAGTGLAWRRRMLHGSPAASAMGTGGRKGWQRKQLQRASGDGWDMYKSSSEPSLRRGESGILPGLSQLSPKLAHSNSRCRLSPSESSSTLEVELAQEDSGLPDENASKEQGPDQGRGSTDSGHDVRPDASTDPVQADETATPRTQWQNALQRAMQEADVRLLFRLDLPLMVKAVADGEITSLSEPSPPRWQQLKVAARCLQQELQETGARRGQIESLQVIGNLYALLEEQKCAQGFDALCKSFDFLFGGLEQAQKVLDVNRTGIITTMEFAMAMSLVGLDLALISGLDEREMFLTVDESNDGSIRIQDFLQFCSTKPTQPEQSKNKADRSKRKPSPNKAKAKKRLSTTAIIESAGMKVLQERTSKGVRLQALVVPKPPSSRPETTNAGMHVALDELDEEEIDESIRRLAKEEVQRAQAKWTCVAKWLSAVLGAAFLLDPDQDRAKTWEDERQQAVEAVDEMPIVPLATAVPAVRAGQAKDSSIDNGEQQVHNEDLDAMKEAGPQLENSLNSFFLSEATVEDNEVRVMDKTGTRKFFEDLLLSDYGWQKELRMIILDRLYEDTLEMQKEQGGSGKGLTFRSLKVVLHRMLRDHAETWMDGLRLGTEFCKHNSHDHSTAFILLGSCRVC